ncbi:BTB/POZ domain-containing protein DOT3-like isoform X1 [Pyrus x bretschneideri]|uniref:BTB/POZ domain-containing protein DOT3-like isoform X1 n=1 Tax=Pyrus x bretschneideri TaxID=225117 RepID=UPI00202F15AD|nr:BTB/POZ domain-containing protein DOT3-like isoform X1 [Pyrus x bretschneideri]
MLFHPNLSSFTPYTSGQKMNKSLNPPQIPEADYEGTERILVPPKHITLAGAFEKKQHSWYKQIKFIDSHVPTDLTIQVEGVAFNVHKCPLLSKCGYIGRLEFHPSHSNFGYELELENFPGGSETFELILKFCYGLPVGLNPNNIAPLRCASEFLEMTEEIQDGNLISKTESFLTLVVLSSWKDTVSVLKSCETLSPWAENLQIVRRCCDTIAWKASREKVIRDADGQEGWWFNEVATFRIDHFMRTITAIRAKSTRPEFLGKCIMHYAERWLTGMDVEFEGLRGYGLGKNELRFSILNRSKEDVDYEYSKEQKAIIESLVSILPPQNEALPCKFLLRMLKLAMLYSASPALISELEKRAGMMLKDANVNDLLIPSYYNADQGKLANSPEECMMHDIEVVQRIVEYFLMHEQQEQQQKTAKIAVSKLLDNYLAEIAGDPNLSITKFHVLAELLPENARTCDDGLYRAIDTYLKTHPTLPEHDRRRLCRIMNCDKLSLDACMHAALNDRLPMRTIVQVLFSEQVKMRTVMQEKESPSGDSSEQHGNHSSTDAEIKNLKAELENVKMKMAELQSDYSELQHEYERIISNKQKNVSGWSLGWRKIKNSFHTKVEENETGGNQQRTNPARRRTTSIRRSSIS